MSPPNRHRIIELDETGSTNADAMRFARQGEQLPLWVTARRQTAGKGRAGRDWQSLEGNLQASLAFHCQAPLKHAPELALLAGVAAIDAIRGISPLALQAGVRLKWPNDVMIGCAKAGGVLIESTLARREPGFLAVIGMGLNVASLPDNLGRAATSLAQNGIATTPAELLTSLADQMDHWLAKWDAGQGFDEIRTAWIERAGNFGEAITVHTTLGAVSGTYQGLSPAGALLAQINGRLEAISFGDVSLAANTHDGGSQ